jgi:hypothetical protein
VPDPQLVVAGEQKQSPSLLTQHVPPPESSHEPTVVPPDSVPSAAQLQSPSPSLWHK